MDKRLHGARKTTFVTMVAAGVILIPIYPPWRTFPAIAFGFAVLAVARARAHGSPRPELWMFWGMILGPQGSITAGAILTGGPTSAMLPWLGLTVLMLTVRFDDRGANVATAASMALLGCAALSAGPGALWAHPGLTVTTLSIMVITRALGGPIVRSDRDHRADAVLDPLTGLLNRRSLEPRVREIALQARRNDMPVSAVALDLDHFKRINDEYGHDRGDAVLQDAAYELRKTLRHFELLYRTGGEEFLLLLPGSALRTAYQLAERLREAVRISRPGGVAVTLSCGVATIMASEQDHEQLLQAADEALYEAKRLGRNRTCLVPGVELDGDAPEAVGEERGREVALLAGLPILALGSGQHAGQ